MIKSEDVVFELPSMTISAQKWGISNNNPTIIALHGWLDSSSSFNLLSPKLAEKYQIIAVDLPGHGMSSHYQKESFFHYVDYIVEIKELINQIKKNKVILMGHSMGGSIVSMLAGTFPEICDKVILLDAIGSFSLDAKLAPSILRKAILDLENLPNKRIPCYNSIEEACIARVKATPMHPESVKELVSRTLKKCEDGKFRWRNDPRLMLNSPYYLTEEQVEAFLKPITAKVLLMKSSMGWPFGEDKYLSRVKCIKNITTIDIEGNHHFHMDDANMVGNIILDFLKN